LENGTVDSTNGKSRQQIAVIDYGLKKRKFGSVETQQSSEEK